MPDLKNWGLGIFYSNTQCLDPNKLDLKSKLSKKPPYSECARFGYRPLSWDPNPKPYEVNEWKQKYNKEFYHEHLKFDQSGHNIGFGADGLKGKVFYENTDKENYVWDEKCYDGSVMRDAINVTASPSLYLFITQNCQTYADRLRESYTKIKNSLF